MTTDIVIERKNIIERIIFHVIENIFGMTTMLMNVLTD